jgi:hypothetical protein
MQKCRVRALFEALRKSRAGTGAFCPLSRRVSSRANVSQAAEQNYGFVRRIPLNSLGKLDFGREIRISRSFVRSELSLEQARDRGCVPLFVDCAVEETLRPRATLKEKPKIYNAIDS